MEKVLEKVFSNNAKIVAIAYDGSEYAYPSKNLLESYLLAYGIEVFDCGATIASALSSSLRELNADLGIFIYKKDGFPEFLIFGSSGFPLWLEEKSVLKEIKKWNEIGSADYFDVNKLYLRKIKKFFNIERKIGHLVFNANFSPIANYVSKLFVDLANRLTTLNASDTETLKLDFKESLDLANALINAYNADLALSVDRHCESISLASKDGFKEEILNKALLNSLKYGNFRKLFLLGDLNLKLENISIHRIKRIEEALFSKDILIIDPKRSTLIFPPISGWFDSIVTFILYYKDINIEE